MCVCVSERERHFQDTGEIVSKARGVGVCVWVCGGVWVCAGVCVCDFQDTGEIVSKARGVCVCVMTHWKEPRLPFQSLCLAQRPSHWQSREEWAQAQAVQWVKFWLLPCHCVRDASQDRRPNTIGWPLTWADSLKVDGITFFLKERQDSNCRPTICCF